MEPDMFYDDDFPEYVFYNNTYYYMPYELTQEEKRIRVRKHLCTVYLVLQVFCKQDLCEA